MRIEKIVVDGLFGLFHHEIPLNLDEHITIIHGPNGFGKTAILKMLKGLLMGDFTDFWKIPFKEFRIVLDDTSSLNVQKIFGKEKVLNVIYSNENNTDQSFQIRIDESSTDEFKYNYYLDKISKSLKSDGHQLGELMGMTINYLTEKYMKISNAIPVHFVETQRLLNVEKIPRGNVTETKFVEVVDQYSKKLAEEIQTKLAESATLSQSLDRSLPVRLVEKSKSAHLTIEELRSKLGLLEEKRTRLIEAGLLDIDKNDIDLSIFQRDDIEESTKNVLSIYLEDVEKKLGFFDGILLRIELLRKIINRRFLYKKMSISREKGFVFKTSDNKFLSPTNLSSGEQHELVLLYDLLFNMEPNALILIDEPELSLHVAWQVEFLKDLSEIVNITGSNFLIATHSPQIVHDRWDLTVELRGPNEQ